MVPCVAPDANLNPRINWRWTSWSGGMNAPSRCSNLHLLQYKSHLLLLPASCLANFHINWLPKKIIYPIAFLCFFNIFLVKPAEISAFWRDHRSANRVPRRHACQVLAEQAIGAGSTAAENQHLQKRQGPVGGTGKDEEDLGVGQNFGTSPFNPLGIPIYPIWVWINTYENTIFSGMNIHLPAILMFTRGTRFWHTAI